MRISREKSCISTTPIQCTRYGSEKRHLLIKTTPVTQPSEKHRQVNDTCHRDKGNNGEKQEKGTGKNRTQRKRHVNEISEIPRPTPFACGSPRYLFAGPTKPLKTSKPRTSIKISLPQENPHLGNPSATCRTTDPQPSTSPLKSRLTAAGGRHICNLYIRRSSFTLSLSGLAWRSMFES